MVGGGGGVFFMQGEIKFLASEGTPSHTTANRENLYLYHFEIYCILYYMLYYELYYIIFYITYYILYYIL